MVYILRKDAVFSYEILFLDFFFGCVLLPLVVSLAFGFSVLTCRAGYRFARSGTPAIFGFICTLAVRTGGLMVGSLQWAYGFPSTMVVWVYYLLWLLWILPVLPHKLVIELVLLVWEFPSLVRVLYGQLFFGSSTQPLRVEQGAGAIPSAQDLAGGARLALAEGLAHVSASGALSHVPRLRARGRATNALQGLLEGPCGAAGDFLRGRWTPDLPSQDRSPILNALLATSSQEMKLLGVGAIRTNAGPGYKRVVYLIVETPHGREMVIPALLARLQQYSLMRERTPELLRGLKARAVEWMKEQEVPAWVSALAVPGCVARACLRTTTEIGAESLLESAGLGGLLVSPQ